MPRKSNSDYNKIKEIAAHYAKYHQELQIHYPFIKNIYDSISQAYTGESQWKNMIDDMKLITKLLK